MPEPRKLIRLSFYALFLITPVFFLPTTSELFEFNKMIIVYLLSAVIFSAWITESILQRRIIFTRTALDLPILVFLLANLISLTMSVDIRTSIMGYYGRFNGGLLSLLCYSLLYWAFVTFMDKKSARTAISTSIWIIFPVCLYAILQHYGIDADLWANQDPQNRAFSTLGQPNWLAAYLAILSFLSFIPLLRKPSWSKFILPSAIILTILFSKSRSGLLAFGLASLVFWPPIVMGKISGLKHQLRSLIILGAFGLIFTVTFSNPIRDKFVSPAATTPGKSAGPALEVGGTESGSIRKIVWTGAVRAWLSSPKTILVGTGPETFTMAYYKFRPVEHNSTSEWDLLYNKAHNEFLNYLTTIGLVGLISYLFLLAMMLKTLIKNLPASPKPENQSKKGPPALDFGPEKLALLAGWLTIPVTNFLGFSVVIVQVFMFVFPAMVLRLDAEPEALPDNRQPPLTPAQILLVLATISLGGFMLISVFKYWLADVKYASGQNEIKAFRMTENPAYLLNAYESLRQAFDLNSKDPVIAAEFSLANAYVSVMSSESDPAASTQLADAAFTLANLVIAQSPGNPNSYKYASRTYTLLSAIDDTKLELAATALEKARQISPTDPTILYNLGITYSYIGDKDRAVSYLRQALDLKPDYASARNHLEEINSATPSSTTP